MEVEHQGLPKKQKSLKLNFIMNAFLTMSNFIFPLITFPYVSRVTQELLLVNLAMTVISYAAFAMMLVGAWDWISGFCLRQ